MSRSEIFDEYAKIATDVGLISLSEEDKSEEHTKYRNSVSARAGSDDIKTIEALYNVKPETFLDYKNCITESAHPHAVVIAPAYDRINRLVENDLERQHIMHNIVMKPTDGNITYHKFAAKNDLLMELIRVANDMDNRGNDELVALVDTCIAGIEKKNIEKIAFPILIPIAAAVLAGIWLWQHSDDTSHGLKANIDNSLEQLNDLKTNSWYESDIDNVVERDVQIIEDALKNLEKYVDDFNSIMSEIQKPTSLQDEKELAKFNSVIEQHGADAKTKIDNFKKAIDSTTPILIKSINNFSNKQYQLQHSTPSLIGKMTGYLGEALHGRWGFIANDFISAVNALNTLKSSLLEARKLAASFEDKKEQYQEQLEQSAAKNRPAKTKSNTMEEDDEISGESSKPQRGQSKQDFDFAQFLGHKPTKQQLDFLRRIQSIEE